MRNGVSFYEFAEVTKNTYVRVCEKDFAPTDAPITQSRIAIITGLTRTDVERLMSSEAKVSDGDASAKSVARVLQGWHEDKDFLGPYGVPRNLHFESDPANSSTFVDLVKRYGSDKTPQEVLEALLKAAAVTQADGDSLLQVTRRYFSVDSQDPSTLDTYANVIRRFLETSETNVTTTSKEKIFQRWVFPDDGICEADWPRFVRLVKDRLEPVVTDLDARFAGLPSPSVAGEKGIEVGVGLYIYRHEDSSSE